jgi:hypothetical protein
MFRVVDIYCSTKKSNFFWFFFFFLPLTDVAVPHQFGTKIRENIRVL